MMQVNFSAAGLAFPEFDGYQIKKPDQRSDKADE